MSLKKVLAIIVFFLLIIVLCIAGFMAKKTWAFSYEIIENVCLEQNFMASSYKLIICSSDKVMIENINGWIIDGDFIYGAFEGDKYFGFELNDNSASVFHSMREMNSFLKKNGLQFYDLSNEENVSHLLYGNGRNRKY
jgi:hypothetical protein